VKRILMIGVLLLSSACESDDVHHPAADAVGKSGHSGADAGAAQADGVCDLAKCPKPETGIACCTPDARCGNDPSMLGLTCQPNDHGGTKRKCVLKDCPTPLVGEACCTPAAQCGWDPFATGAICFANAQVNPLPDAGAPMVCNVAECPKMDGGPAACCQLDGQCGFDTLGNGSCQPPPTCDLSKCPTGSEGGPRACCQMNGECGIDTFNVGICFPPPRPLCDLESCPTPDGGGRACCLQNGQCGVDTLGIGLCSPPPATTCNLSQCPRSSAGLRACCMPNGDCGFDSLGIGVCFAPPPTLPDGGATPVVEPPNDPSITGECPSFIGLNGPIWGCCSAYGVCGEFAANQCLLPVGTQIPTGPPPPPDAGVTEPFLRCTAPARTR
jgi:hypothetical protein